MIMIDNYDIIKSEISFLDIEVFIQNSNSFVHKLFLLHD